MMFSRFTPVLAGFGLCAALALPARADHLNSRVLEVNVAAHTITTIEGRKPFVFSVTEQTRFVDAKGALLATGLKIGDADVLVAATQKGYLKPGTRLSIEFAVADGQLAASIIQFIDMTRAAPKEDGRGERN